MESEIKSFQVKYGDCFFIRTYDKAGHEFVILIDGGPENSFKISLKKELKNVSNIDLLINTHIDDDHIKGIIDFLDSSLVEKIDIKNVLINAKNLKRFAEGKELTYQSAVDFEKKILEKYPKINIYGDYVCDEMDKNSITFRDESIKIKILSPNRYNLDYLYKNWTEVDLKHLLETKQLSEPIEDQIKEISDLNDLAKIEDVDSKKNLENDRYNASSLAFILETLDFKGLFLGDAWPSVIKKSLEKTNSKFPIKFDLIKVSHHGSKYNTTKYLMGSINSKNFVISTNGAIFNHPDIESIAKIVCAPNRVKEEIKLWFNYKLEHISKNTDSQEEKYNFKCEFDKQVIEWKTTC